MSYEVKKQVLTGHTSDVNCLDFSHSDVLVSGSNDRTIRIWTKDKDGNYTESKEPPLASPLIGHNYGVNCVRFSPFDTIIASGSTDGSLILWNAKTCEQVVKLQHPSSGVIRACAFAPSSAVLATAGDDEFVCLWDISTRTLIRSLVGHEAMVTTCAFSPDSNFLVSGSTAGDLKLWDACLGHGKPLATLPDAHDLGVCACDFSSQYQSDVSETVYLLASSGNDDRVRVWKVRTGDKCVISPHYVLEGHAGNVNSCRFSVDGTILASAAGDKMIILWNTETGKMVNKLEGHQRFVTSCAFSPDNRLLATGSNDKSVIVWSIDQRCSTTNGTPILNASNNNSSITAVSRRGDIVSWTVDHVVNWLLSMDMSQYEDTFRANRIDGPELLHLTHQSLEHGLKIEPLGDRNRILREIHSLCHPHSTRHYDDHSLPPELLCPITRDLMKTPVVAADGYSYEKNAILTWIESGKTTSPMTNEPLSDTRVVENRTLALLIANVFHS